MNEADKAKILLANYKAETRQDMLVYPTVAKRLKAMGINDGYKVMKPIPVQAAK